MEKLTKTERIQYDGIYVLNGDLDGLINKLSNIKIDNPLYFNFRIELDYENGYYSSVNMNYTISADRWETDEEFEERKAEASKRRSATIKANKTKKIEKEKQEFELYKKLKAKYENDSN